MKNPNWTEEELILALDVYFKHPSAIGDVTHPAVIELSEVLNSLDIHSRTHADEKFRNVNGVATKLANLRSHDPNHPSKGLAHGSRLEAVVWKKYANDPPALRRAAIGVKESHGKYVSNATSKNRKLKEMINEIREILSEIEKLTQ